MEDVEFDSNIPITAGWPLDYSSPSDLSSAMSIQPIRATFVRWARLRYQSMSALRASWSNSAASQSSMTRSDHRNEKRRTSRSSEWELADSLRDKFNVIGGWLPSGTFALGEKDAK